MNRTIAAVAAASLFALAPLAVDAQSQFSYRCVSKDGRKHYGSTIPPQCYGQPVEQLNRQGMVVKRFDGGGTDTSKAAKGGTPQARAAAETPEQREASRQRNALLATYANEKEIEVARQRALREQDREVKTIETRLENIRQTQEKLNKEMEFYKGKGNPPAKLTEDIRAAQGELAAHEGLLATKKKEIAAINARYDQDKKRYQEAVRGK